MNRLFLLYYPALFLDIDKDELIGIYDDVIELKEACDMVLADNDKYFEFLINNPYSELTVKEFDSVNQKFIDVDLEKLGEYADKLNHNYQAINLIISHEDMYSFYKNNVIHTKSGINICGDCPNGFDHKDISSSDIAIKVYFSNQSTSEIMLDLHDVSVAQEYAALNRRIILREILKGMKWKESECIESVHNYIDVLSDGRKILRKVHFVESDIIHLMRGQVFDIGGTTFFTFGGAYSIDRMYRTE